MPKLLAGAAFMCLLLALSASAQADKKKPPTEKQIVELIGKLGDPKFDVRQEAQQVLVKIGKPALPHLRKAAKDGDVEIQERARRIIREIEDGPATPPKKANAEAPIAAVASVTTIAVTKDNQAKEGVEFTLSAEKHPDPTLDTIFIKLVLPRKGKVEGMNEVIVQIKDGDALSLRVPLGMKKDEGTWSGSFHMSPAQAKKAIIQLVCPSPVPTTVTTYEVQVGTYIAN